MCPLCVCVCVCACSQQTWLAGHCTVFVIGGVSSYGGRGGGGGGGGVVSCLLTAADRCQAMSE